MQRDHSKKRLDSHNFESNGIGGKLPCYLITCLDFFLWSVLYCHVWRNQLSCFEGLYGQHSVKKMKTSKQSLDNFDNVAPITNSIPSPAASQMSNMSNPSKFIRIISGGRDRGRKTKALKVIFLRTQIVVVAKCLLSLYWLIYFSFLFYWL